MVYLDYAATSPLLPEVIKAMHEAEQKYFANASALHTPGHLSMNKIEETRELLAKLINADLDEIIFTSGASESNNTVIRTFEDHEIITSPLEHHSIIESAKELGGNKKPTLYSYMYANNEIGELLPIEDIVKEAHVKGGYIHSDLTQALGKVQLDIKALDLDYATF
ncbi:aminotransferase class V-fold PLP-dependent enzyme, partial [Candidatus Saccharibacteria bacterium]|nr:aminotransferase class V-fold PLP-dependent enzyme [Candidatus Saccharibacteria bacterium]